MNNKINPRIRGAVSALLTLIAISACGDRRPDETAAASLPKVATFDAIIAKSHCLSCHEPGNQMGSPVWRQVAARYKKDGNAGNFLAHKIAHGGSGSWGKMDMPPYPELTEPELKVLVQGILTCEKTNAAQ